MLLTMAKQPTKASGKPKGSVLTVTFELEGQGFMALNGGPVFKFSPAISFFVNCEAEQEIEELWKKLSQGGGKVLMQLDKYSFSAKNSDGSKIDLASHGNLISQVTLRKLRHF